MPAGNHQLSSRLAYNSGNTPAFLRVLQARVAGRPLSDDDEEPTVEGDEYEQLDSNRPAIPRRPAIPVRPDDDPNRDESDEESGDEKPTVVVLKAGKHLTKFEAVNEQRKAKGLQPIAAPADPAATDNSVPPSASEAPSKPKDPTSLSFSSSSKSATATSKKRKVVGEDAANDTMKGKKPKKPKKESKSLVSFGDD